MCGLASITAWFDVVIRAYRNIDLLFVIPVQVTKHEVVCSIWILFPSFKGRSHVLSSRIFDLCSHAAGRGREEQKSKANFES